MRNQYYVQINTNNILNLEKNKAFSRNTLLNPLQLTLLAKFIKSPWGGNNNLCLSIDLTDLLPLVSLAIYNHTKRNRETLSIFTRQRIRRKGLSNISKSK